MVKTELRNCLAAVCRMNWKGRPERRGLREATIGSETLAKNYLELSNPIVFKKAFVKNPLAIVSGPSIHSGKPQDLMPSGATQVTQIRLIDCNVVWSIALLSEYRAQCQTQHLSWAQASPQPICSFYLVSESIATMQGTAHSDLVVSCLQLPWPSYALVPGHKLTLSDFIRLALHSFI